MPFQLLHEGVVREFEFYAPFGWQYWHERVHIEDGRLGLPLIVALHGGGQQPANFALDWPFPLLFNSATETNWQDRCFVLYPYGYSYMAGPTGDPLRSWNVGFSDTALVVQSDVGFIKAMIAAVERMLEKSLDDLNIRRPPIDANRRYLFGYSMGGMMSYRLANKMPDTWAALWVMSGAFGGRSHDALTATVTNPPQGRSSVSLFAHHGELDTVVPPGPRSVPAGLARSDVSTTLLDNVGLTLAEAQQYAASFRHLAAAVATYRTYNNCKPTPFALLEPPLNGQADVAGTNQSLKATYRQDGDPPNPEVVVYRDPTMEHANFVANRYFTAADVWQFFKDHPRVDL